MNSALKKLVLMLALLLAATAVGCGDDSGTTPDVKTDRIDVTPTPDASSDRTDGDASQG